MELAAKHKIDVQITNMLPKSIDGLFYHVKENNIELTLIALTIGLHKKKQLFILGHELAHFKHDISNPHVNIVDFSRNKQEAVSAELRAERFSEKLLRFIEKGIDNKKAQVTF